MRCGTRSRRCSALDPRARQRQGVDRQPRRRRRRRSVDLGPGAGARSRPARVSVRLHDTLTGETRPFVPLQRRRSRIYSCGPTVYGPAHIGNFRSFLFADLLVRHLRWRGYRVRWVMNITDIDDKIIRGAAAAGVGIGELAERYLERVPAPTPTALRMTTPGRPAAGDRAHRRDRRADRDAARRAVTPTGPTTARSSSGSPRGRRTAASPAWTPSSCASASASRPTSTPRTTSATSRSGRAPSRASRAWSTTIGEGRPGWHIECSAMSMAHLGPVLRHPHRRRRPDLPAPRGRDRPERGRHRPAVRADVAALRPPPDGRREDGQVDREHRPASASCCAGGVSPRALRYALLAVHYRARLELLGRVAARRRAPPSSGSTRSSRRSRRIARTAATTRRCPRLLAAARAAVRRGARRRPEHLRGAGARCSIWSAT